MQDIEADVNSSMSRLISAIKWLEMSRHFPDRHTYEQYFQWDAPSRQVQISAITALTALLYVVFTLLNKDWVSDSIYDLMVVVHVLIIIPFLLTISVLAYKQQHYDWVMSILTLHPVVALSLHAYIASQMTDSTPFLTEGYLGVFWTFIASGLTFRLATFSALISTLILLTSASYFIDDDDAYAIHAFWLLCSFSFGFLGAYLYDRARKAEFMAQLALERLAITDPLTGVFNRSQLAGVLSQEMERARRYQTPFGFMVIDIDYFKAVNDTYGHDQGDKVLTQVAQVLSDAIRETDTLIRWGGEEFVVIALGVDEPDFIQLSNKLREQVELAKYDDVGIVTVSVGATLFRTNDTQSSLFTRTDKALYQAKQQGRNTTVYV